MTRGYKALTEKEKQTLRLVVRGYDAKSMARHLGLSVHTINERLRYARRKLEVSSSREAARILLAREGGAHHSLVDKPLGEAAGGPEVKHGDRPDEGRKARPILAWTIGGLIAMSFAIAALLFAAPGHLAQPAGLAPAAITAADELAASPAVQSARKWLALVDEGRWNDSWDATGQSFKLLNTSEKWAEVSEQARPPLGAVISRTASSQEFMPAPPYGYQMVKFHTQFANRPDTTETVTLSREAGTWKVVGYWIG